MVSRGRPRKFPIETEEEHQEASAYDKLREERIKANLERMKNLGILDLSRDLNLNSRIKRSQPRIPKPLLPRSRSSSRLKTMTRVNYSARVKRPPSEKKVKVVKKVKTEKVVKNVKTEKVVKKVKIDIPKGSKPEIYTEEHEKLLGDSNQIWDLYVDGYDNEGQRIYDLYNGRCCHQCRQKTLGHHTTCGRCKSHQGTLCGDCLYSRYGENVMEANANKEWSCPACRGICNCCRCRRKNGWAPTGSIYTQVKLRGYKSVAHYLIKTRGPHGKLDEEEEESSVEDDEGTEGRIEIATNEHDQDAEGRIEIENAEHGIEIDGEDA